MVFLEYPITGIRAQFLKQPWCSDLGAMELADDAPAPGDAKCAGASKAGKVCWAALRPAGPGVCQAFFALIRFLAGQCAPFDAVLVPVWFWPVGAGISSLALQVIPGLRRFWDIPGDADRISATAATLVAMSDDVHSVRAKALRSHESDTGEQQELSKVFRWVSTAERHIYAGSDLALFATVQDVAAILQVLHRHRRKVERQPYVHSLYVRFPSTAEIVATAAAPGYRARAGLVFVGSGGVETNYQAIEWFLSNCYRALRLSIPGLTLTIIGALPNQFARCRIRHAHCNWTSSTSFTHAEAANGKFRSLEQHGSY